MWDVRDVENPQTRLPVGPIDVGPSETWVVGILAGPGLNRHVVDVYPAPERRLPADFGLSYLHYPRQVAVAGEVEVGDGDASACVTLPHVARLVVGVGDEDVPLVVDHMGVEVMRSTRMVSIVPRVDPARVTLVRDVDQRDCDLGRILPLPNVGVGSAWVDQLVLHDDVLPTVVLKVLDIEDLGVRVVVDPSDRGV